MTDKEKLFYTWDEYQALADEEERELAKKVKITDIGIVLDGDYEIEWDRINTAEKILVWVRHLTHKNWITTAMLERIIELAATHWKIELPTNC